VAFHLHKRASVAPYTKCEGGGLTREDLLGKNMWEVFPEAVGTTIYDKYHEAMRGQETVRYETHFPPNDAW
jgi:hypothetical protein